MAVHQITPAQWNATLGTGGAAKPGDTVELLPDQPFTGQQFKIFTPGAPDAPIVIRPAGPGVVFDGAYTWPDAPAANTGPGGLEVVYQALIQILAPHVHLLMPGAQLIRSRGHGVTATGKDKAPLLNVKINGFTMIGLRSAGIRCDWVDGYELANNTVSDAGNYYPEFRASELGGWPMVINSVSCSHGDIHHNTVTDSFGEGINASRDSDHIDIYNCMTRRLMGVHYYAHGCSDTNIFSNLAYEYGDFLRLGSPPDLFTVNPGEVQYEGKQTLASERIRIYNNIGIGGFHNFGVWAAGAAPLTDCLFAYNTAINARSGKKKIGHGSLVVRGGTNISGLRFESNMFHQADGLYGDITKGSKTVLDGNGWNSAPPPTWNAVNDRLSVALRNPDAPLTADVPDLRNYEALEDLHTPDGALPLVDYRGKTRRYWTVGALEYVPVVIEPPPPPAVETVRLALAMDVAPEFAAALRKALAGAVLEVV